MLVALNEETSPTPAFTYARRLRENQALIASGRGDSPEAEALADRMDGPWYQMTPQEQDRMGGLSEDLYALAEGGPKRVEMLPAELAAWKSAAGEVFRGAELENVDTALAFLRQPIPMSLPRHIVPFLQARCWEKLGDMETALVFMKEAERLILASLYEPVVNSSIERATKNSQAAT